MLLLWSIHWLSKDKDAHSDHFIAFILGFQLLIFVGVQFVACWNELGCFFIYFTELLPKERSPCFFLILLKTPGHFRVELRQTGSSKAECTSFKSSQQGTASQGHTASRFPEPGSSAADCFPEATSLPGSISREAQCIWTADTLVSELTTQCQGMHKRSIAVPPYLLKSGIHSSKCMPPAVQKKVTNGGSDISYRYSSWKA